MLILPGRVNGPVCCPVGHTQVPTDLVPPFPVLLHLPSPCTLSSPPADVAVEIFVLGKSQSMSQRCLINGHTHTLEFFSH